MATKKRKLKKKAAPKRRGAIDARPLRERLLQIHDDIVWIRAENVEIHKTLVAICEATERLDRDVAKLNAETIRQQLESLDMRISNTEIALNLNPEVPLSGKEAAEILAPRIVGKMPELAAPFGDQPHADSAFTDPLHTEQAPTDSELMS